MTTSYGGCSKEMYELLEDMSREKDYLEKVRNVEKGLFGKPKQKKKQLVFERQQVLCSCKKKMHRVERGKKRSCVDCFIKQQIFDEEIKRAGRARVPVGYLILKNDMVIPFVWNPDIDYLTIKERRRKSGKCLGVVGLEGQMKYIPASLIVKIEGADDDELAFEDCDQIALDRG
ncbi:hypothetical protein [Thermoactinomyces sp. DSM 45892]|uniref:hypothetical protein n=1 Tax=Thermoactinomyces sp. DSM 45892 TaxID=1882753 RepID=UPI00089A93D4|nr:hypothetical protein [Thermoactinomyces sp. DSM 45892]SDY83255.1 hypothetical protein SAMN05444416_10921 [Thermoactinomyces sp. DSM 45892]